jgi:hypothetical protein
VRRFSMMKILTSSILFASIAVLGLPSASAGEASAGGEQGYMGVKLGPIPEALAAHLKDPRGSIVEDVLPGSPADKAGLQDLDLIVSLNGQALGSPNEVRDRVRGTKPGETVKLGILRGNQEMTLEVTLGAQPPALPEPRRNERPRKGFLGIAAAEVPSVLAHHLALGERSGVIVGDVVKGSPAEAAGVEMNDVVTAVDGNELKGVQDFMKVLSGKKAGDGMKIDFIHRGEKKGAEVKLGEWPKDMPAPLPGFGPMPSPRWWGPGAFGPHARGRITLRGPDGQEHSLDLPESFWKAEDLYKDLERQFEHLKDHQIPGLKESLEKTLQDLKRRFKEEPGEVNSWSGEARSSVIRSNDGAYDITIRDQDGTKTVTVMKDGKPVAENLSWDKLDTLPPDVRERIEKVSETLKVEPAGKMPHPRIEKEEGKIRA